MTLNPLSWLPFTCRQRLWLKWHQRRFDARLSQGHKTSFRRQKQRFYRCHGYPLNLEEPRSFNEKIWHKKIFDRNPLMPLVADKLRVRDHVRSVLGNTVADHILIPLLHVTRNPADIPFDTLPSEYIIKSNYGSGCNLIVTPDARPSRKKIIRQCQKWLCKAYGITNLEWAYQKIDRCVLLERLMRDNKGDLPQDFKFHMIHGKCAYIHVNHNNRAGHTVARTLYSPDWTALDQGHKIPLGRAQPAPSQLNNMLQIARALSKNLDYVRIDLYTINTSVYFGEMTNYPNSGLGRFTPQAFDFELGTMWTLPK